MIQANDALFKERILKLEEKFIIPVFQRNYSWEKEQCDQLIEDIFSTGKKSTKHFIGIIISERIPNNKTYINENIIIDGQQRITTSFLIIKALLDLTNDSEERQELESFLFLKNGEKKLSLNVEDDKNFDNLLFNHFDKIDKKSGIYKNYINFKFIIEAKLKNEQLSIREVILLMSNLVYVQIHIEKEDNPQVIFERINSTGVDLSTADLIRNYLLMSNLSKEKELYTNYWLEIENKVLKDNMNTFVHHYLIYKIANPVSEKKVYSKFKEEVENIDNEIILQEMLELSEYYCYLIKEKSFKNFKINKLINDLIGFNQKTSYPFLMHIFEDFRNNIINEEILGQVLKLVRDYLLKRMIYDPAVKSLNNFFATLYKNIFSKGNGNKQNYYDSIASYFFQIKTADRYISNEEFEKHLLSKDLYHAKNICKYLLWEIEHFNSKEFVDKESLSIEHIMPQTENEEWANEIGKDIYESVKKEYLHTIGNLTLTASSYNSKLSNNSFSEKKQALKELNTKIAFLNLEIWDSNTWNESIIVKRAERLISICIEMFDSEKPQNIIKYEEFDQPLISLNNYNNVDGTKLVSFSFNNEKFYIKHYSDLLRIVLEKLYLMNPNIIEDLANKNYSITGGNVVDLTYKENNITKSPKSIMDTGIIYNANRTPTGILDFVSSMLDQYQIDKEIFEIELIYKK